MRSAYNETSLYNLFVLKEVKRWWKHGLIQDGQYNTIRENYICPLFHPNFIIRILLFIAGMIALSGVTGTFMLFMTAFDPGVEVWSFASILYGVGAFFFLKYVFINNKHYKSGITEILLYHAIGYTFGGLMGLTDFNVHFMLFTGVIVLSFAAYRYVDLLTTLAATLTLAGLVFYEFYNMGGIFQQIIPFVIILFFTPLYFIARSLKQKPSSWLWTQNLIIIEAISLLLIYAGGNYLVVRELSIALMDLVLEEGQDIPFAILFYGLTLLIPVIYLYLGIKKKDVILLRVSLILVALSVFTFKYYYGFHHPEITLTVAGALLLIISYVLFNYLKIIRGGFTRDNLLSEKWSSMNVEAFVVSQTLGGNQVKANDQFKGGGGEFGGGGASGSF